MTGSPSPNNQDLLTTLVQATAELAQSNKELVQSNQQQHQRLDAFGAKIDTFGVKIDTFDAKFDVKIDAIADQIGKLFESITVLIFGLDEIKETTRQQTETARFRQKMSRN